MRTASSDASMTNNFKNSENFRDCVQKLVADIPVGKVMTYGQIAALCGNPRAARIVGGIAHWAQCIGLSSCEVSGKTERISRIHGSAMKQVDVFCPSCDLPWHRVVNRHGGLARGYPGGRQAHARHLATEGINILDDYRVDIDSLLWRPDKVNSD